MNYNINDPSKFLKDKKFLNYCAFQMNRGNLIKILPNLVVDLWFLLIIPEIRRDTSISHKYIFYGLIKNPKAFNRLLEADLVYGLKEYFKSLDNFYKKYESPDEIKYIELSENEEIIDELNMLDDNYHNLVNALDIRFEIITYYERNKVDLEFEINYESGAGLPANLTISKIKSKYLMSLYKDICDKKFFKKRLKEANSLLKNGDVQPGVVVSISPLKIFAYSDLFSGGVMLAYPNEFVEIYNLKVNQKVIFVNNYYYKGLFSYRYDLLIGEEPSLEFRDIIPLLPLVFSDEDDKINNHLLKIDEEEWDNVYKKIELYKEKFGEYSREGMEYFIHEK